MNLAVKYVPMTTMLYIFFLVHPSFANSNFTEWVDHESQRWVGQCSPSVRVQTSFHGKVDIGTIHEEHKQWVQSLVLQIQEEKGQIKGKRAYLPRADLSGLHYKDKSCWAGAELGGANLQDSTFQMAIFDGANMRLANMTNGMFLSAFFRHATLGPMSENNRGNSITDLTGADLRNVLFTKADLRDVIFHGANLTNANLSGADLRNADLTDANLTGVNVEGTILELATNWEPDIRVFATWENLEYLTYDNNPHTLHYLKNEFKRTGYRDLERALRYAIEIRREEQLFSSSSPFDWVEAIFRTVFFRAPSAYGMAVGRPWAIILGLTLLGSIYYTRLIYRAENGNVDIQVCWKKSSIGYHQEEQVDHLFFFPKKQSRRLIWTYLGGLWFSILSSFTIGWRDLNVGQWLSRLQPREFYLWPTGWVRFWSTLQSLICVYLLALWALIYFGRPFE